MVVVLLGTLNSVAATFLCASMCHDTLTHFLCECTVTHCLLQEDYTHLLRVLSTRYFKARSEKGWELTDIMKQEIAEIVAQVLAKCSIYSQESDIDLGLTTISD